MLGRKAFGERVKLMHLKKLRGLKTEGKSLQKVKSEDTSANMALDPITFIPLLRAEISTVDQLYIHQETLQCISAGCIVCSYKLLVKLPSGARKVCIPNQRPEQCLRCVHRPKTPLDTTMAGLYPSSGNILILGDGDLSFSLALCHRLAACRRRMNHPPSKSTMSSLPPVNVVATTYLTKDQLRKTYPSTAGSNMVNLIKYGVVPVHGVDATTLGTSKCKLVLHGNDERKYHRVIWNFPCVHSPMDSVNQIQRGRDGQSTEIEDNKRLMVEFFNHVVDLLVPGGEVHIVHKTKVSVVTTGVCGFIGPLVHWSIGS